jgi:hypothetical protein
MTSAPAWYHLLLEGGVHRHPDDAELDDVPS